jgi:hypothetical protein
MPIDLAHKEDPLFQTISKIVISVKTGIQKALKSQFLWAPAFAGATNQNNKRLLYELSQ